MWQSVLQGCPSTAGVTTRIEEHVTWKVGFQDFIRKVYGAPLVVLDRLMIRPHNQQSLEVTAK